MIIRVKNWHSFQHYKDRSPKWIKLHKTTLDDYRFQCLPVDSRALAPMVWLLASEYENGVIDASLEEIAFRLHRTPAEVETALKPLIEQGFLIVEQDASKSLAEGYPREEKEEEIERELETDGPRIVFEIATSHPKLSHLRDESEIPHAVADAIIQAIDKDSPEIVLEGTRGWAQTIDDPKFAVDPYKFFSQFKYRREAWASDSISKAFS